MIHGVFDVSDDPVEINKRFEAGPISVMLLNQRLGFRTIEAMIEDFWIVVVTIAGVKYKAIVPGFYRKKQDDLIGDEPEIYDELIRDPKHMYLYRRDVGLDMISDLRKTLWIDTVRIGSEKRVGALAADYNHFDKSLESQVFDQELSLGGMVINTSGG